LKTSWELKVFLEKVRPLEEIIGEIIARWCSPQVING
jgi:hypothetical protein